VNRRPRIAMLSEHASPAALLGGADAGGQNVYVDALSRQLGQLGLAVDVYVRRERADAAEVVAWAPGVRIVNLPAGPACPMPKDDMWRLMPAFRDALLGFIARDGVRYDALHGNFWMSGWVTTELRSKLGIPAVQIFHALGTTKRRHQGAADTSPPDRIAVERLVVAGVDRLIAQCPNERGELVDDYGARPERVALIPAGVDTRLFRPEARAAARREIGLDPDGPLIVYVGRLLPRKGIRNVVRALACLVRQQEGAAPPPRMPLLMVVGGETAEPDPLATPEIGELQKLARALGIADRVRFTGQQPQRVLRHFYCAGDVVVTTPWYEPFGLTPLEGMACGRPVIGSAVGGIAYTVQDGITGYLVPPEAPEALAGRLRLLLARPDLRASMGQAARTRVEREFTWPAAAGRIAALYDELLASPRRSWPATPGARVRVATPERLAPADV
jgi:D-inositol-3-phosphate glycosyltransferase